MQSHPLSSSPQPMSGPPAPGSQEQFNLTAAKAQAMYRIQRAANWFFFIAGLSLVNSVLYLFIKASFTFVVGLAYTQLIDGIVTGVGKGLSLQPLTTGLIALIFDVAVALVFVLFGYFARGGSRWAFIVGMIVYGIDAALFLLVTDILSIAFHAFALFMLFNGLNVVGTVEKIDRQLKGYMP